MSTFDSCVEPDEDGTEFVAEVRGCRRLRPISLLKVGVRSFGRSSRLLA